MSNDEKKIRIKKQQLREWGSYLKNKMRGQPKT